MNCPTNQLWFVQHNSDDRVLRIQRNTRYRQSQGLILLFCLVL